MKDRRGSSGGGDRFAVFPFSMGCMSQSAVAVADPTEKKPPQSDPSPPPSSSATTTAATTAQSEFSVGHHEQHDHVQLELYCLNSSFFFMHQQVQKKVPART
jgi:hypothetical protein